MTSTTEMLRRVGLWAVAAALLLTLAVVLLRLAALPLAAAALALDTLADWTAGLLAAAPMPAPRTWGVAA